MQVLIYVRNRFAGTVIISKAALDVYLNIYLLKLLLLKILHRFDRSGINLPAGFDENCLWMARFARVNMLCTRGQSGPSINNFHKLVVEAHNFTHSSPLR